MKKKKINIQPLKILNFQEEETIDTIKRENTRIFELTDSLTDFGLEFITNKKIHGTGGDSEKASKGIVLALYTKSFKTFRSIVALCKCGLGHDAMSLLRVLYDTVVTSIYLLESKAMVKEAKRFMNTIIFYDKKILNGIKNSRFKDWLDKEPYKEAGLDDGYKELYKSIKDETGEELITSATMQELKEKFGEYFLFAKEASDKCADRDLKDTGVIVSPLTSGVIHCRDIHKHIYIKQLHENYGLFMFVSKKEVRFILCIAIFFFLKMIDKFNSKFDFKYDEKIKKYCEQFKEVFYT